MHHRTGILLARGLLALAETGCKTSDCGDGNQTMGPIATNDFYFLATQTTRETV